MLCGTLGGNHRLEAWLSPRRVLEKSEGLGRAGAWCCEPVLSAVVVCKEQRLQTQRPGLSFPWLVKPAGNFPEGQEGLGDLAGKAAGGGGQTGLQPVQLPPCSPHFHPDCPALPGSIACPAPELRSVLQPRSHRPPRGTLPMLLVIKY